MASAWSGSSTLPVPAVALPSGRASYTWSRSRHLARGGRRRGEGRGLRVGACTGRRRKAQADAAACHSRRPSPFPSLPAAHAMKRCWHSWRSAAIVDSRTSLKSAGLAALSSVHLGRAQG
jgi:hypothetical protein